MTVSPLFASTLGQIFQPFFKAMAWLIAFFYALVPNYAIAIALLTVTVMIVTAPLTIKSTRSMLAMQRLQPEMKKLQAKYKGDRTALNEEMMKLYKEHNVNPAGGCLPMVIQIPVFFILYDVIRGLTHTVTVNGHVKAEPYYIGHSTKLYQALTATPGEMKAFGINLADSLFSHQSSWIGHVPYALLVLIAIALQYLTMRQMNRRNPAAAQANPQMQAMQKYMPLIFAVIYLRIAAGVNIYFIVSALCRMGLQWWAFQSATRHQAALANRAGEELLSGRGGDGAGGRPKRRTLMDRFADMQQQALEQQQACKAALEGGALAAGSPTSSKALPKGSPKPSTGPKTPAGGKTPGGGGKTSSGGNGSANGNGSSSGQARGNGSAPADAEGGARRSASSENGGSGGQASAASGKPRTSNSQGGTAKTGGTPAKRGTPPKSGTGSGATGRNGQNGASSAPGGSADAPDDSKDHPRSKAKRTRKAR